MKRRLDDVPRHSKRTLWDDNHEITRLEFPEFRAAIVMLSLAQLFKFTEENFKIIRDAVYNYPKKNMMILARFKNYLSYMQRRDSLKIPKEEINEYFGGNHYEDVIMPGTV